MTARPLRKALPFMLSLALGACATPAPPTPAPSADEASQASETTTEPTPVATRKRPPVPGTNPLPDPLPAMPLEQAKAAFVRDTAAKYGVDAGYIESVLANADMRESIIKAMSRPAEAKPWRDYRPIFISQARIDGGQAFMARHRDALARVESRTGVPAEIIVAIIGVETSYGANTGSYPVVDALYTLAFAYPRTGDPAKADRENRREAFFRGELAQLFALGKEQRLDVTTLKGSYAGAMGWGQFMPSSYREFAADGNGDGRIDLFNSTDDVFASIANYFVEKGGWTRGGPITVRAMRAPDARDFEPEGLYPDMTVAQLGGMGYRPMAASIAPDEPALLINLDGVSGREHWLGFDNFYAITRYNISKHYAMAVYQLSEAIAGRENPLADTAAPAAADGA
ncbi:lytic murein transglycosylase B [Novilysobacter selenitireducens]|uniref:Lytic murein transglycosylase B n=1 Tax=Novilysobacter selenitireducens TaxID=2872639 RepID=A0ABS7T8F6_9GAMM|nr:lytic murein transglycosylase B [Lysobacter selenitireducens]MBZ4040111.1 lytic murein transglycosylase B [Lysobacter selenitireducens]